MQRTFLASAAAAICLSACAGPQLTEQGASVQVQRQDSALLSGCSKLGPVSAVSGAHLDPESAFSDAEARLRNRVAAQGGDTLVVVHQDVEMPRIALQGVALRCYGKR